MRDYSEFLDLLDGNDVNPIEAANRASRFLVAMSYISRDLLILEYKTALADDAHDIEKAETLISAPDSLKNAAMRDAYVARSPSRRDKFTHYLKSKSEQEYTKRLFIVFQRAHEFYAQRARYG